MTADRRKVVILDFDGTLVESVGIKDEAFRTLYADEPDHLPAIMAYHLDNNHVLRFAKFRHIAETILGRPYGDADRDRLTARFSALVKQAIAEAPEVAGTTAFLADMGGRAPLYLLSMSPDEELREIVAARGLSGHFKDIYGGRWTKAEAVRDILAREGAAPDDAVMVGDSPEDHAAAVETGIAFVARDSGKPFPPDAGPVAADMTAAHAAILDFLGE